MWFTPFLTFGTLSSWGLDGSPGLQTGQTCITKARYQAVADKQLQECNSLEVPAEPVMLIGILESDPNCKVWLYCQSLL
ncbi:hypothetical protein LZ30DRAFT_718168 [Colletotrichum cereale]|nr:hypothetical protein LZ30DRAFT_718168 [Colletotrichum cereale]